VAAGTTRSGGQLAARFSPPYNLAAAAVAGQGFFNKVTATDIWQPRKPAAPAE